MKFRWLSIGTLVFAAMSSLSCGSERQSFDVDRPEAVGETSSALLNQGLISSNEPFLAINPLNPLNIAVASGTIRVSTDGGKTFTTAQNTNLASGAGGGGDSSLTFDGNGNLFWVYMSGDDAYITKVDPTTGLTTAFPQDVRAPQGFAVNISVGAGVPGQGDRPDITADRFAGSPYRNNLYVAFAGSGGTRFSRSTDGGVHWSTAIQVTGSVCAAHPLDLDNGVRAHTLAVGADGRVYVAYHLSKPATPTSEDSDGTTGQIVVRRSDDGGQTFPSCNRWVVFQKGFADMTTNAQYSCAPGGVCVASPRKLDRNRNFLLGSFQPYIVPDPTDSHNIAIVAADDPTNTTHGASVDDASIYIVRSTNRGATWTNPPMQVDLGTAAAPTSLQFMPTATADLSSKCLAVSYYDNRRALAASPPLTNSGGDLLLDLMVRGSSDGGANFGPEFRVNDAPFDPDTGPQYGTAPFGFLPSLRIGEYNGLVLGNGLAHAVWTSNNASGNQQISYTNVRVCADATQVFHAARNGDFMAHDQKADIALLGGAGWNSAPVAASNGDGTFSVTNPVIGANSDFGSWASTSGVKAVSGDFNGDGVADIALTGVEAWDSLPLALSSLYGPFTVVKNISMGSPFPYFASWTGEQPVAGDFDGDGKDDIAITGPAGTMVALSHGDGTFSVVAQPESAGWFQGFNALAAAPGVKAVSGDFDGDGIGDIALTGVQASSIPLALGGYGGVLKSVNLRLGSLDMYGFSLNSGTPGVTALPGDFNGDGKADIALVGGHGWTSIPVAFSNGYVGGVGSFQFANHPVGAADGGDFPGWASMSGAKAVSGDYNNDGRTDIALLGGAHWDSIAVAFAQSDGSWIVRNLTLTSTLGIPFATRWAQTAGVKALSGH